MLSLIKLNEELSRIILLNIVALNVKFESLLTPINLELIIVKLEFE